MFRMHSRKTYILFGVLFVILVISTSCQVQNVPPAPEPILLGGFPDLNSSMQNIYRYDSTTATLVPVIENAVNLSYLESITYHSYSSVFSPDNKYMAVDVMDYEGYWDLKIFDVNQRDGQPIATAQIGTQLPKLREGFSNDGRYYAFSFYNETSGILDMGILDLVNQGTLIILPSAYFIDFSSDDQVYAITINAEGQPQGVVKFNPVNETTATVYQPSADGKLGLAILSPDQEWLLFTDQNTKTLNRVPVPGGTPELVYQLTGDNAAINYDQTGRYLIVLDLGTDQQLLKLFDLNFKEVYSLNGIGTTTMDFSNDGRFFAYQLFGTANMELYLTDFQARTYFFIANSGIQYKVGISPDNKYLAYLSIESNVDHAGILYLVRLKDLQSTKIESDVTSFKFDSDSTLLFVKLDDTDQTSTLFHLTDAGSAPTSLISGAKGILFLVH